ncbi:TrkA family potassium uptake protein [bacterium]|nr:TrkA family potassium uptake protein [bacterium]
MKQKSILLVGLGRFGKNIASKLNELDHEVMAIDQSEERVNDVMGIVTTCQIGDSTNELFMSKLGIDNFDLCIVAIGGNFQSSLETTNLLKELGAKKVISRAENDVQAKFLLSNGADEVVYPEKQLASWMAIRYSSDHILDYIELDETHGILEVKVPKDWVGKSIIEIDIRKRYGLNIMGIKKNGSINVSFDPSTILSSEITLLVLGELKKLQKFFNI